MVSEYKGQMENQAIVEGIYEVLNQQFEAVKADNDVLEVQNQKLQAKVIINDLMVLACFKLIIICCARVNHWIFHGDFFFLSK